MLFCREIVWLMVFFAGKLHGWHCFAGREIAWLTLLCKESREIWLTPFCWEILWVMLFCREIVWLTVFCREMWRTMFCREILWVMLFCREIVWLTVFCREMWLTMFCREIAWLTLQGDCMADTVLQGDCLADAVLQGDMADSLMGKLCKRCCFAGRLYGWRSGRLQGWHCFAGRWTRG